jgi:hypothetical protein
MICISSRNTGPRACPNLQMEGLRRSISFGVLKYASCATPITTKVKESKFVCVLVAIFWHLELSNDNLVIFQIIFLILCRGLRNLSLLHSYSCHLNTNKLEGSQILVQNIL